MNVKVYDLKGKETGTTLAMNKKERQKALMCMLSNKAKSKAIVVVKDLKLKEIKTQIMDAALKSLPVTGKVLVALHEKNENASKSTSNLKYAKSIDMNYLNIADLLKYETLLVSEAGLEKLNALSA